MTIAALLHLRPKVVSHFAAFQVCYERWLAHFAIALNRWLQLIQELLFGNVVAAESDAARRLRDSFFNVGFDY